MEHADFCASFTPVNGKVLDVGSGRGKFAAAMSERGFQVFGVEVNPEYIAIALNLASNKNVTVTLVKGMAEHLPYDASTFDFVNCSEVTEHVENPVQVITEIWRVLKPGGNAYVSFHNRFGAYDYHYHLWFINWLPREFATKLLLFLKKEREDSGIGRQRLISMHYYTFKKLKRTLENIGFTILDTREQKIKRLNTVLAWCGLVAYKIFFRPFYFNSFHLVLTKKPHDKV